MTGPKRAAIALASLLIVALGIIGALRVAGERATSALRDADAVDDARHRATDAGVAPDGGDASDSAERAVTASATRAANEQPAAARAPSDERSLDRFIHRASAADLPTILATLRDRGCDDSVRNEMMNLVRRLAPDGDPSAESLLTAIARDARETDRMRGFAVQHLGMLLAEPRARSGAIAATLRAVMDDRGEPATARREAMLALANDPAHAYADRIAELATSADAQVDDLVLLPIALRVVAERGDAAPAGGADLARRHLDDRDREVRALARAALAAVER